MSVPIRALLRPLVWVAVICALTCSSAGSLPDSAWSVRVWQAEEGLSNNNVTGLTQTADGYLWIATRTNLARFDGVLIEEYATQSLVREPSKGFRAMHPSRRGGLWLASDIGDLVHLNGKQSLTIARHDGPGEHIAHTMVEDGLDALWIAFRSGAVGRVTDGKIKLITTAEGLPPGSSSAIATDREGRLWLARGLDLCVWKDGRFHSRHTFSERSTMRLAEARGGGLWLCVGHTLYRLSEDGGYRLVGNVPTPANRGRPTALYEDSTGAVWIGTLLYGLFRYDGRRFEAIPVSDREINSITEDREGNIWIGTAGGGINRVQPRAFALETPSTGLPFDAIQSVCQDANGAVWAATQNGMLVRHTPQGWQPADDTPAASFRGVTCLAADREGGLWIGTSSRSVHRLNGSELQTWRRSDGIEGRIVHALLVAGNGDLYIAYDGTDAPQLIRGGKVHPLVMPAPFRRLQAIVEAPDGAIWLGGEAGALFRVTGDKVADEAARLGALKKNIRSLCASSDGTIWVGYAGAGLGRVKDGRLAQIFTDQGLADFDVSQIVPEGESWLWLASDRGIFKARRQELDDVADGKSRRVHCVQYGKGHGLPSLQAKFGFSPTATRTADGKLWLPMRTHLVVIDPTKLREDLKPPVALLKALAVDDQTVASYRGPVPIQDGQDISDTSRRFRLPGSHRRLDFLFTALSLSVPENTRFRYQLIGLDEAWVEAQPDRRASYTRLAAGDYRFRVVAGDSAGTWNQHGAELAFTVAPFFWQTWWFLCAILAIFAFIVAAAVRYLSFRRLRGQLQQLEQQAALHKERSRIARDIHDDLGGSLTHMTLLLELTLRDRKTPDQVELHTEQGLGTARKIIKSLDETVWALNPRNDTLSHLINYMAESAFDFLNAAGIRCRVDLPMYPSEKPVSSEVRHHLFFAMKEALNNVVRHAGATEVALQIVVAEDTLKVIVQDNGHGFERAPDDALADGLRNMRQRMEEIGGSVSIASQPGKGTNVSFIYPWPRD